MPNAHSGLVSSRHHTPLNSMVAIVGFPPELLLVVAEQLADSKSRSSSIDWEPREVYRSSVSGKTDLAALSLVSTQMRAAAAPYLFERIQPPPSLIFADAISREKLRKTLASTEYLTKYAKTFRLGFNLDSANATSLNNAIDLLLELLRICPQLTTILGMPMACLDYAAFVQAINNHSSVSAVCTELRPYIKDPVRSLVGALPGAGLLRKFECTLAGAPDIPLEPMFQAILAQGIQIKRVCLRYTLSGSFEWFHSPYFSNVEELVFSNFGDNASIAATIVSALRTHKHISRVQLSYMPLTMLYRLCGQEVPPIWTSSGRLNPSASQATCYVDESGNIACRSLRVTRLPSNLECTTAIPAMLGSLSGSFPLLEELDITFPRTMSFPHGPIVQDADTVRAYTHFNKLQSLTLRFEDSKVSEGDWARVQSIVTSLAKSMPCIRTISVNPQNRGRQARGMEIVTEKQRPRAHGPELFAGNFSDCGENQALSHKVVS